MIYFVIRHRPTGRLLPARVPATVFDFDTDAFEPRLFSTERAAKNCATCWAKGPWKQAEVTESEGWEYPSYTYLDSPAPVGPTTRTREDLEVLQVSLDVVVK